MFILEGQGNDWMVNSSQTKVLLITDRWINLGKGISQPFWVQLSENVLCTVADNDTLLRGA